MITEWGVLSFARFCYVFPCELRGPALAVGSYSISQSARGTSQNIIFKTLRHIGRPALYLLTESLYTATYRLVPTQTATTVTEWLASTSCTRTNIDSVWASATMHIGSAFDFAHWARVVVVIRVRKCQLEVRSSAWQGNVGNKEVVAINQVKSCL